MDGLVDCSLRSVESCRVVFAIDAAINSLKLAENNTRRRKRLRGKNVHQPVITVGILVFWVYDAGL